jgi:hypothetical protein
VFDSTDPVANYILPPKNTGSEALGSLNLKEVPYKASQIHLLSHTQYLAFDANRSNPLIAVVTRWLLSGNKFQSPLTPTDSFSMRLGWPTPATNRKRFPIDSAYYYLGIFCWVVLAAVISTILSKLLPSRHDALTIEWVVACACHLPRRQRLVAGDRRPAAAGGSLAPGRPGVSPGPLAAEGPARNAPAGTGEPGSAAAHPGPGRSLPCPQPGTVAR